jgi:hypothetical protein
MGHDIGAMMVLQSLLIVSHIQNRSHHSQPGMRPKRLTGISPHTEPASAGVFFARAT